MKDHLNPLFQYLLRFSDSSPRNLRTVALWRKIDGHSTPDSSLHLKIQILPQPASFVWAFDCILDAKPDWSTLCSTPQGPDSNFKVHSRNRLILTNFHHCISSAVRPLSGETATPEHQSTILNNYNRFTASCGVARMPLTTPVLSVDADNIHKVDTANAQSLHGMWMGK